MLTFQHDLKLRKACVHWLGAATARGRRSQGRHSRAATTRGRYSQGAPLYSVAEHFASRIHSP